jgi:hypothetical protein
MAHHETILNALSDAGVEFIVGGGMACILQGVERLTMDVDVAVMMQEKNWERLVKVTENLGLIPRVPLNPRSLIDPAVRRVVLDEKKAIVFTFLHPDRPSLQLDVFLRPDLAYEVLLKDAQWMNLEERKIQVLNRQKLLALKKAIQPPRPKDLLDIAALEGMPKR